MAAAVLVAWIKVVAPGGRGSRHVVTRPAVGVRLIGRFSLVLVSRPEHPIRDELTHAWSSPNLQRMPSVILRLANGFFDV